MFQLHYTPIIFNNQPSRWQVALIPWDTETFGFCVATLRCGDNKVQNEDSESVLQAIEAYSQQRQIKLITATIPAKDTQTPFLLQHAGFDFIDIALGVEYENLDEISTPGREGLSLHLAVPDETETLMNLAGSAFRHGRYHLDPVLPTSLANQRYKDWLARSMDPQNNQQVLTARCKGEICGFSIIELKKSAGYLHLHALDSKWQGKGLGYAMILQSLNHLRESGANHVGTKISGSNLKAINMHARLNGRFSSVERLLHWHT